MKVLVTGSSGQLARSLVERAASRANLEVIAVGRPQLDLEIRGSTERIIATAAPDVVINASAYTAVDEAEDAPERAFSINADGAREVAAAAARAGAPIIQISTDYVFDGRGEEPYGEDAPTNPVGIYGQSKLSGEQLVRSVTADHLIVRTAWVYSPFGLNFVKTMMSAAETRDCVTVVDDQRGNPSSALDLAEGLLHVLDFWRERPRVGLGQTYHLAGSGETSWCGFAQVIMTECASRGLPTAEVRPICTEDWPTRAERPRYSVLNSSKFARAFKFSMPDWRRSLREVVERLAAER
jgi:dTDP-4-dehydrorhamnose reductase